MFSTILIPVALGIVLLLLATIVFDILHFLLHRWAKSPHKYLRTVASLHTVHHRFLDQDLQIHREFIAANVWCHVLPEFLIQVLVTILLGLCFPGGAVGVALGIEGLVLLLILKPTPGFDINHHSVEKLKAYRPLYFCVPEYHLLHHVYPEAHFSSWIKTLDHLLQSGAALSGRKVLMTAVDTPGGKGLLERLRNEGCQITTAEPSWLGDTGRINSLLADSEILLLCHIQESASDYEKWIERFYQSHRDKRFPVEVWACSNMKEATQGQQREFFRYAKKLFSAEKVIYRHLVFSSIKPDSREINTIFRNIKRGFNFVPGPWNFNMIRYYLQFVLK